jgi:hypothetical protein
VTGVVVWTVALALYLAFRAWYDRRRPPLAALEIESLIGLLPDHIRSNGREVASLRDFLSRDDGREFAMLNLVKLAAEPVPHPATGVPTAAVELLRGYSRVFFRALLRKACHPAVVARKVGDYLDSWNVPDDPGWSVVGYVRYRSRRDMMELVTDPRFAGVHPLKIAATALTFSFPTEPQMLVFMSPRVWVGLLVALGAALLQLALR